MLSQADEARTSTDRAGAKEKVQLEVAGSYGTDGNIALDKLNDNLLNIPGIKKHIKDGEDTELTKDNQIEGLPTEVVVDGYIFEISDVGVVTEKGEGSDPTPPPSAGDEVTPGVIVTGSNKTYTDESGDTAVIPVGFAVSEKEDEKVIDDGLVIKDEDGNEFVWIPVDGNYEACKTYARTNVSAALTPDAEYLPTGVTIPDGKSEQQVETDLVTTNMLEKYEVGGFYISRYEAGKDNTGTLVSKKGADVWVNIAQGKEKAGAGQPNCKDVAKTFAVKDDNKVKSGLCTGIQWDMVMAFITKQPPRKDGSGVDDYIVTESKSTRHTGSKATSGQNEADKVCNIYDLEGNFAEYIAEKNTYSPSYPYDNRGGYYSSSYGDNPASYRSNYNGNANINTSFRFVLYIM